MEPVNSIWLVGIAALVIGAIIGAIAYRLFTPTVKNAAKLRAQLDEAKEELDSYKASVSSHFNKTSDLVNELTQDYVKVYKHLAEGAQTLGDAKEFTNVLEQHQGKVLISFGDESEAQGTIVSEQSAAKAESESPLQEPVEVPSEQIEAATQENISETIKEVAEKIKGAESTQPVADAIEEKEPVLDVDKEPAVKVENDTAEPKVAVDRGDGSNEPKLAVQENEQKEVTPLPSAEPKADPAKTKKAKQPTEEVKQESDFPL
ncbi:MAG: DUF1043 family protein [Arenicellales bacterium]|nr:DUF1043 family protein [Arenicellales bacterium]